MDEQFVTLVSLGQGAALEKFQDTLDRVLENILDPNTKATAVRSVTLTVTFKPDEDRSFANAVIDVKGKLAPPKPVGTAIYIGKRGGLAVATERDARQMKLDDNVVGIKEGQKETQNG